MKHFHLLQAQPSLISRSSVLCNHSPFINMVRSIIPVSWSNHVNGVFLLCLFLHHSHVYANIPITYSPIDNLAINCGASGDSTAPDGRVWGGDIGSKVSKLQQPNGKSVTLKSSFQGSDAHNPIPYITARISRAQFTYTFVVNPGQKFIRLHFYSVSYPGFERSNAFFTVKAGRYTLLSNFSPSLTADYLGSKYLVKEFCLNVEENRELTISFLPSPRTSTSRAVYAFINGIEIVSMPTALYYTHHDDQNRRFYIENNTALEMVHRLNVGGSSVSAVQDSGMFREWSQDSRYLIESGVVPIITTIPVTYTSIPAYSAPQKIYQSMWSTESSRQSNRMNNFTWKLPVDLGFRYLVRLHFCELEYGVKETGQREFSISINKQTTEASADVMEWSGGIGVAVYKDYVIMMEGDRMQGKHDLLIALQSHCNAKLAIGPILNGLEVFKLSNPDNNLAGSNPVPVLISKSSKVHKLQKSCLPYVWNVIINSLIIFIMVVNITVHYMRVLAENSGKENISKSCPKAICRPFSLPEMQTATNNFDDALIIGCGGFGKVYRGVIDDGATTVAIKRLNPASNQGPREFWTEIEMLSKLRHNHLLTLLGYCNENVEMILVYEYMAHGTLADHLYKNRRNKDGLPCLNWEERLNICIGAARGLNFLHIGDPRIIHRDVKSTNILLDESWVPKISDFGLSKMGISNQSRSYISTTVKGTYGYVDPEYYLTRRLTRKSDVYAFGVVLLEVLCGRPPVDTRLDEEQLSLALWANQCIREGKLDQLIDPYLGTQISPGCLKLFTELAMVCLCKYPKNRPTMNDVLGMLEHSLASQRGSPSCIEEEAVDSGSSVNEEAGENNQSSDLHVQQTDGPTLEQDGTPSSMRKSKYTVPMVVKSMTLMLRGKNQNMKRAKRKTSSSGSSLWSWWPKAFRYKINETETNIPRVLKDPEFYHGLAHRFSLKELQIATDNFSDRNVIGRGGFGKVYRGRFPDGSLVAVKRRKAEYSAGAGIQFDTELLFISMAVHRNLLRLRGFCITPTEQMLVYPFMVNGSLASCLRERSSSQPLLVWPLRKRIALDAATGLVYLHEHCDPTIIHRDVKAANILLDKDFEAIVADFGLAKLMDFKDTHVTTAISGTIGHIAPEYLSTGKSSVKTDVFGYGVMLLELISGQRAIDLARVAIDDGDLMLLDWVEELLRGKKLETIVDADLQGDYIDVEVEQLLQVALLCTSGYPVDRPKMSEVVTMLEGDGLAERWEEWAEEEERRRLYPIIKTKNAWVEGQRTRPHWSDSTCSIRPEELSGPR